MHASLWAYICMLRRFRYAVWKRCSTATRDWNVTRYADVSSRVAKRVNDKRAMGINLSVLPSWWSGNFLLIVGGNRVCRPVDQTLNSSLLRCTPYYRLGYPMAILHPPIDAALYAPRLSPQPLCTGIQERIAWTEF